MNTTAHPALKSTRLNDFFFRAAMLAVLLSCIHFTLDTGVVEREAHGQGQLPNAGLQRDQLLRETQTSNQILGEIRDLLKKNVIRVQIMEPIK